METIPTLLRGIGGIGGRVVSRLSNSLSNEERKHISTVLIDSSLGDLEANYQMGCVDGSILLNEYCPLSKYVRTVEEYEEDVEHWLHRSFTLSSNELPYESVNSRQDARLMLLSAMHTGKLRVIINSLEKLCANNRARPFCDWVRIYIVSSLAGNTSSGILVQLPFIIRNLIESAEMKIIPTFRGFFIDASITSEYMDGMAEMIRDSFANAYAAIKELNGLYCYATTEKQRIPIELECYEPTKNKSDSSVSNHIPYEYVHLMQKYDMTGRRPCLDAKPCDYETMAVNTLRVQMIRDYDFYDHLLHPLVKTKGMARFNGLGSFKMEYPIEAITEYCTLRWAADSIKAHWRRIDDECLREHHLHKIIAAPDIESFDAEKFFMHRFEELTDRYSHDAFFRLLALTQTEC